MWLQCHQPSCEQLRLAVHVQGKKREATFRNTQLSPRCVKLPVRVIGSAVETSQDPTELSLACRSGWCLCSALH